MSRRHNIIKLFHQKYAVDKMHVYGLQEEEVFTKLIIIIQYTVS